MDVELYIETGEQTVQELTTTYTEESVGRQAILNIDKVTLEKKPFTYQVTTLTSPIIEVTDMVAHQDGKLTFCGMFDGYSGEITKGIVMVNNDGTIDNTFNSGTGFNVDTSGSNKPLVMLLEDDGKILVGVGSFTAFNSTYNGTNFNGIVRLNSNGSLAQAYTGMTGSVPKIVLDIKKDYNNKIYVAGTFLDGIRHHLIRLNSDLTLDTTFNANILQFQAGSTLGIVSKVIPLADNKVLIFGNFQINVNGTNTRLLCIRLNSDGSVDNSFLYRTTSTSGEGNGVLDSQGRVVMFGSTDYNEGTVIRTSYDGDYDSTFTYYNSGFISDVYEEVGKGYVFIHTSAGYSQTYDNYPINSPLPLDYSGNLRQEWKNKYNATPHSLTNIGTTGAGQLNRIKEINNVIFILGIQALSFSTTYNYIKANQTLENVPRTTYERLDMFDDENINIKFKLKDSSDLSKIYSTFSQTFTVPPSNKNNKLLNYYFNTDVVRNSQRYIKSKIYVNRELFKVGFISVNEAKYKMGRNSSYSINFFTSLTSLKELFGDELLTETLLNESYEIEWNDTTAFDYTRGIAINPLSDPDVIVPLVSNKRVWTYEAGTGGLNNIRYTGTKTGVKYIEADELRPAIPFSKIMNSIADAKGLQFKSPLFGQDKYEKMYAWCNSLRYKDSRYTTILLNSLWSNFNPDWTIINTLGGNTSSIYYNGSSNPTVKLRITTLIEGFWEDVPNDTEIKFRWVNVDTNKILSEGSFFFNVQYTSYFNFKPSDYNITSTTPLNLRLDILTDVPFKKCGYNITLLSQSNTDLSRIISNLIIDKINLYRLFPNIKTIDFVSSFIKMFNISIIEDQTNTNIINFVPRSAFYNNIIDYTPYIDVKNHNINTTSLYKRINFKHKTSKYKSNEDFKIGIGNREYGELQYNSNDVFLKDEYKIETQFSIVPNRVIPNTNTQTFYGFTSDSETNETYGTLYTPNTEDLTIFYYNGSQTLKDDNNNNISLNFQNGSNVLQLQTYNKVSIVYDDNQSTYVNSLGFKDEVDTLDSTFIFSKNLFSNYYKLEIDKIYNPNSRLFTYDCILPVKEINRFSLINVIQIGDKKFTVEDADINIINGKAKLTLMNIAPTILQGVNYPLTPPTVFTATLL